MAAGCPSLLIEGSDHQFAEARLVDGLFYALVSDWKPVELQVEKTLDQ
jgi:hypothetical protein